MNLVTLDTSMKVSLSFFMYSTFNVVLVYESCVLFSINIVFNKYCVQYLLNKYHVPNRHMKIERTFKYQVSHLLKKNEQNYVENKFNKVETKFNNLNELLNINTMK